MELFSSWAAITLKYLVYHTEKKAFIRGQRVYKQGEIADGLYIIREGEFQMVCKIPTRDSVYGKKFFVQREKMKQVDVHIVYY